MFHILFVITLFMTSISIANDKDKKGLLPELKIDNNNEDLNEKKQLTSELMINKAEDKALESLQKLLKRNKGTAQEPDLLYRLAELYMRKSKTGRFFDLHQDSKTLKLSSFPIPPQKGKDWIRKASQVYSDIEKRFPQFSEMDAVLFNNAFAHQQLGELKKSEVLYRKLLGQFERSALIPDTLIALGELLYDQTQFRPAEEIFQQIDKYPNSRVYSYGLYKWAWSLYNLKMSDEAISKLVDVVNKNPPRFQKESAYYLRKEALRDLVIFIGDVLKADEVYEFFKKITTPEELGESISNLAKLYESYSREKEIHLFMNEFLKKEIDHPYRVRAHMILVNTNEAIKKREDVLINLKIASELCDANSVWKAKLEPSWAEITCSEDYRKTSLEIAKKWWEIWIENKKHPEFSKLTEKALRLVLKTDNPEKPDFKTRYALAELLFQQSQFDDASLEYEKVGKTSPEPQMIHDANYAALFSIQKSLEQKKTPDKQRRVKDLSLYYVEKHPKGQHSLPVQLQLAISEYEAGQDKASEEFIKPLLTQKKSKEIKTKAQDLFLDILNFRKDFTQLKIQSAAFLKDNENELARKNNLTKINEEAHYSEIQRDLDKKPKIDTVELLISFRNRHSNSMLSKEALWQALSIAFAEGYSIKGAELAREFSRVYKDDKRTIDVLRESAKAYLTAGRSSEALMTFEEILKTNPEDKRKIQEAMIELSLIEGKNVESRKKILELMKSASNVDKKSLQERYLNSFSEDEKRTSPEYKKYEHDLINQGFEPFATEYWTKLARTQFEKKQMSQAFQSATKAMSRDSEMSVRAESRYIQARILEQEFIAQSVKVSSEDRLALVLNIKTEKLDKALTAYNSASKMTKDAGLTVKILEGLDRCYSHFVSSLKSMPLPSTLAEADQKTLRSEIDKIVAPIERKKEENFQALLIVQSKATSTDQSIVVWSDLAPEATPPIEIKRPLAQNLEAWIPSTWDSLSTANRSKSAKCETFRKTTSFDADKMSEYLSQCYFLNQFQMIENEALVLTETPTNRAWGLFYLSLIATQKNQITKAHWLAEKSLELSPKNPILLYQKMRTMALLENLDAVSSDLIILFNNTEISFPDIKALKALHFSKQGDWKRTLEILDDLPTVTLEKHRLTLLLAEAQNKTGDPDSAIRTLQKSKVKDSVESALFVGRIFEVTKPEISRAQESYKKALSLAQEPLQKQWIERKLSYLSSLKR
jgi:tetratricopeptide (TPR) repeat protein